MTAPTWHTTSELVRLRAAYGRGTAIWASERLVVEQSRWVALSGGPSVLFNEALCHGPGGGAELQPTIDEMLAAGYPCLINVAGEALADVATLSAAGWICVGASPFMVHRLGDQPLDPDVRRLTKAELPAARQMVQDAFGLPAEPAALSMPDSLLSHEGCAVWGLFDGADLLSCVGTTIVDDVLVGWAMATPPQRRRHGLGARLISGVRAEAAAAGATHSLLRSSQIAESLYLAMGFELLEWWQSWSRPRWLLARN
jgi:GNAT superfamily N-acetyltransferase